MDLRGSVALITGGPGVPTIIWVAKGGEFIGVCALSVAVTINAKVPACVGVPTTEPSPPKVKPGGNWPVCCHV